MKEVKRQLEQPRLRTSIVLVAALYAGVLLGCSFLATSVKFLAPTLTLPVAMDVGRHTFAVLLPLEWVLAALLAVLVWLGCGGRGRAMIAAVLMVLAVETLWLWPILDARAVRIIADESVPWSVHHLIYSGCEVAKLILLLWLAAYLAWRRAPAGGSRLSEDGDRLATG